MTTPITQEQELRAFITGFLTDPAHDEHSENSMTAQVFRIARAAVDAEPVAWSVTFKDGGHALSRHKIMADAWIESGYKVEPLYAAPPAPVVQCPFPCGWNNLNKLAIQDAAFVSLGLVEGEVVTEEYRQAIIANNDRLLKVIASCRDFMLQGGKS